MRISRRNLNKFKHWTGQSKLDWSFSGSKSGYRNDRNSGNDTFSGKNKMLWSRSGYWSDGIVWAGCWTLVERASGVNRIRTWER